MSDDRGAGFAESWRDLHPAFRRGLELAYQTLAAGGLPVGAVLTDNTGQIVAEGRNRAYDPPGGPDVLQGTPLAHAELNVLAAVRTDRDLAGCTLWSTHEPCSMCTEAASFTEVGAVRYLAPDPWAVADQPARHPADWFTGPGEDVWVVCANLLFLHAIASRYGVTHGTVVGNLEHEPETARLVVDLVTEGRTAPVLTRDRSLTDVLAARWDRIAPAAAARARRTGRQGGGQSRSGTPS
ncbi:MAG TPA: nucleoside deaminase [Mycobacteriales bacterium]|nr:nucleoside deaminase [Mycobacteriales bacterium]